MDGEDLVVELFDLEFQMSVRNEFNGYWIRVGTHLTPRVLYLAIAVLSFVLNWSLSSCPKDIVLPALLRVDWATTL